MHNIVQMFCIARTEAKLLVRSMTIKMLWFISLLSLVFIVFFPQYGMSEYDTFLPGMQAANCFFLLSIFKIILSSFISPVFIYEDNKYDSYQSLSARPFINLHYLFGKMIGFTGVMVVTDYIFMLALYIYHLLSYDYSFIFWPYLFYPIIITLPLSIFVFGVNAFAARIRYSLVYLMPILMVLVFFPLQDVESRRFLDLGALTVPLAYSAVTGFYDVKLLVVQRLIFVFAGVGFAICASLVMETVRQSLHKKKAIITGLLVVVCFIASIGCAFLGQKPLNDGIALRDALRQHQDMLAEKPQVEINACHLDVTHNKRDIDVIANVIVSNPNTMSLSQFWLNLNPGFTVKEITSAHLVSDFKRDLNTIEITLASPLNPNERIELEITYSGSVDQDATYLHIPESFRERNHRIGLTVIGKQVAFIEPNYVILPAEVNWYPTAVPTYHVSEPGYLQRDLAQYSLNVSTREGLTPISQGEMTEKGRGVFSFTPDMVLTQVSLVIGDYTKQSVTVDNVEYSYHWLKKGFVGEMNFSKKNVMDAIASCKNEIEYSLQLKYPFQRFQVVQTPVHYFGYNSALELTGAYDQPEVSFISESPFNLDKLAIPAQTTEEATQQPAEQATRRVTQQPAEQATRRVTQQPAEQVARQGAKSPANQEIIDKISGYMSIYFCRTASNSLAIERKINPTCYVYSNVGLKEFSTDPFADYGSILGQYAVFQWNRVSKDDFFNLIVINLIRSKLYYNKGMGITASKWNNTDNYSIDRVEYQFLSSKSLKDIIYDKQYHYESLDILNFASPSFFKVISMKTNTDISKIENTIIDCLPSSNNDIVAELSSICNTNILNDLSEFSEQKYKAYYDLSDITVSRHLTNNRYLYNARFKISNPTPYPGYVRCSISSPPDLNDEKYIYIEPFTQKELGLVLTDEIYMLSYWPFPFAQNTSSTIMLDNSTPDDNQIEYFDGIIDIERGTLPCEIVIDNLDEGCDIINPTRKSFLMSAFERQSRKKTFRKFISFKGLEDAPEIWTLAKSVGQHKEFYGLLSSCYYTESGDGESAVEFSVTIPEKGDYNLYLKVPTGLYSQQYIRPLLKSGDLGETTVRVFADDGVYHDTADISKSNTEWAYVGTYAFSDTTAVIQVTDKSTAKIVIADAIKLRKVK